MRVALLLALWWPLAGAGVRITYLANEGVLIESGGSKVLIDALFRDGIEPYVRHSPAIQEQIETGSRPFDGVGLALATHFHLDHWDAGAISRFLNRNPRALFASTPDATAMMPSGLRERVRALWPKSGERERFEAADVVVEAFPLEHGKTQNLGYRVTVGGRTIVHLGDAVVTEGNLQALIQLGVPNIAMVPWWWLMSARSVEFLGGQWRPKHLLAIHFSRDDVQAAPKVSAAWPGAWTCTRQGEARDY